MRRRVKSPTANFTVGSACSFMPLARAVEVHTGYIGLLIVLVALLIYYRGYNNSLGGAQVVLGGPAARASGVPETHIVPLYLPEGIVGTGGPVKVVGIGHDGTHSSIGIEAELREVHRVVKHAPEHGTIGFEVGADEGNKVLPRAQLVDDQPHFAPGGRRAAALLWHSCSCQGVCGTCRGVCALGSWPAVPQHQKC